MKPIALTVAGSDPSGGAGIQADLKTFHQFGVYGMSVVTLLTVQNTLGVSEVQIVDAALVSKQLTSVLDDIQPGAAKTGALGDKEVIEVLSEQMEKSTFPWIVDPVMMSKNGKSMLQSSSIESLIQKVIPLAYLVTPNTEEAEELTGIELKSEKAYKDAAKKICDMGAQACLIKGGHRSEDANDYFFSEKHSKWFRAERIASKHTHGTGCTYSAAITALVADGTDLIDAITQAKAFISEAIASSPGLGHGCGPLNHHVIV